MSLQLLRQSRFDLTALLSFESVSLASIAQKQFFAVEPRSERTTAAGPGPREHRGSLSAEGGLQGDPPFIQRVRSAP